MTTTFLETPNATTSTGGRSVGNFAIRWVRVKKPTKKNETLAAINKRLFADPKKLLAWGEENTRRLTGHSRI